MEFLNCVFLNAYGCRVECNTGIGNVIRLVGIAGGHRGDPCLLLYDEEQAP